jgi:flagellar basal body-associated protein FliL
VTELSKYTYSDLHDPAKREEVKNTLSTKVREAYEGKKVVRVIFTSFVMQ